MVVHMVEVEVEAEVAAAAVVVVVVVVAAAADISEDTKLQPLHCRHLIARLAELASNNANYKQLQNTFSCVVIN